MRFYCTVPFGVTNIFAPASAFVFCRGCEIVALLQFAQITYVAMPLRNGVSIACKAIFSG